MVVVRRSFWGAVLGCIAFCARLEGAGPRPDGTLRVEVVDRETGQPVAARMHLNAGRLASPGVETKARAKRPVKLMLPGSAEFGGHFYLDGTANLPLKVGVYSFELEATPEYLHQTGQFQIERHADDTKRIEMRRFADLAQEGWFGGDVEFKRAPKDLPLILRAEGLQDIQFARFAHPLIDADSTAHRRGTANGVANRSDAAAEESTDLKADAGIATVPYAWNLPVWMAHDELSAIELIHRHSLREGVEDDEKDGRPRDPSLYPGSRGNGRWSETVYYHVLNCGFHVPPVAGSGSGNNKNPVGTNRVYVYCGEKFTPEAWWEGLRAGRVFVTNGPLLRPTVQGESPGYVFHIEPGQPLSLEIGLNLATRVPVEYLQIIKNGDVAAEVRLADWKDRKGRLPPLGFDSRGWFLVRAVTNSTKTYQFASSGPYYVESASGPRISKASVRFFLDWIAAAEKHLRNRTDLAEETRNELLARHSSAREFFISLLSKANAE
ncbi:MAG: CehA/McbA family metallohydrolase [Pirellulales bacterium]|nr:CehA/McbA family metallohydrolase [Pirellulales bacterium]